jgi:hypothetical protein
MALGSTLARVMPRFNGPWIFMRVLWQPASVLHIHDRQTDVQMAARHCRTIALSLSVFVYSFHVLRACITVYPEDGGRELVRNVANEPPNHTTPTSGNSNLDSRKPSRNGFILCDGPLPSRVSVRC